MYAFIGGMGDGELLLLGFIVLLLFGKRLPEVMRHIGGAVIEFRGGAFFQRRLTPRDRYEAEKQAEEFARRSDQFGQSVVILFGVYVVALIVAYLLRDFDLF
jgi:Sec-independent protein translocase protein TatA